MTGPSNTFGSNQSADFLNQRPESSDAKTSTFPVKFRRFVGALNRGSEMSVNALNAAIGDYLQQQNNPLATQIGFYHQGKPLVLTSEAISQSLACLTGRLCILVHGLGLDENYWRFGESEKVDYGSLLAAELGYTPFYLRYNTGLHISQNGRMFSQQLTRLVQAYPLPIEEIVFVAHSMGGLVSRSAGFYGQQEEAPWIGKVKRVFLLGSPHHGAPLEKLGNLASNLLRVFPLSYTRLAGQVLNLRSAGIKDLRYGYLRDEDWSGKNPDALLSNQKQPVPLLDGVHYYAISGTLTSDPSHPLSEWLGDILVRRQSAHGKSDDPNHHIDFEPENCHEFPGFDHFRLGRDRAVYAQLKSWCQGGSVALKE